MTDRIDSQPPLRLVSWPDDNAAPPPVERGKPRPKILRALGPDEPPPEVEIGGKCYRRLEILKHDSWAATAIYASDDEKIVCKFNRQQSIAGLPMRWLGRKLAARENHMLAALADLPQTPAPRGPVRADGRVLDHVAAHVFIEGHPLTPGEPLDDRFFDGLHAILSAMHARGLAYVDLHKSENILVGDDGQAHLIDFQVCYIRPRNRLLGLLLRRVERMLQEMDFYHYRKHLCTNRPDLAGYSIRQLNLRNDRPWWIKAHRAVAVPLRGLRRRLLVAIGVRKGKGEASTEHFAEDAIRRRQDRQPATPNVERIVTRKAA